ncbi:SRPBCC domain-containing protein [Isoptericola sp. BMS4]|uniref:SRPBCC domain-containing protein n=1 Tax=Isoptericola sp. BMS4 TaxID=2527875 RepID=UPI00142096EC|nr:SRPBCC domain-containing protein [Isoptericola sp. BMS4]
MPLAPVRRQVLVPCDAAAAFRSFVDDVGLWWPLATHGVLGAAGTVAFTGGLLVETGESGETATWGTVTESRAGESLAFTWHPGRSPEQATRVGVTFVAAGDPRATLVTLRHDGWEAYPDPAGARARYAGGWVGVLDRFAAHAESSVPSGAGGDASAPGEIWLVLEHTAGPAAPSGGVFSSPDFAQHVEFLASLRDDGVLVAAGPLPDRAGAGMTMVRVTGADTVSRAAWVVAVAQHEDASVTGGLLEVLVRPWHVVMRG